MAFENIANGLMTDLVTQVAERTHNPAIAPTSVLTSHLEDQFLDGVMLIGTAWEQSVDRPANR